jgi:hypothetical protein
MQMAAGVGEEEVDPEARDVGQNAFVLVAHAVFDLPLDAGTVQVAHVEGESSMAAEIPRCWRMEPLVDEAQLAELLLKKSRFLGTPGPIQRSGIVQCGWL